MKRPHADTYDAYFRAYVERVPDGDVFEGLERQASEALERFGGLDNDRALHRYAPGKWSVKDVLTHLTDGDRIFATRALRIARGETQDQPGFDHDRFVEVADADARPVAEIVEEFALVRRANVALFRSFDDSIHSVAGVANGARITVGMVPWLCAGHVIHHLDVLRERYGV